VVSDDKKVTDNVGENTDEWIKISITGSHDTEDYLPSSSPKEHVNNISTGGTIEFTSPICENPFADIKVIISSADCSSVDNNRNFSGQDLSPHANSLRINTLSLDREEVQGEKEQRYGSLTLRSPSACLNKSCDRGGRQNELKQRLEAKRAQRHGDRMNMKQRKRERTPEQQQNPNHIQDIQYRANCADGMTRKFSLQQQKEQLSLQLFEVELVLRKKLSSHNDVISSLGEAQQCMAFLQQLKKSASECRCTMGVLFRIILPHDADTHLRREDSIRDLSTPSNTSLDPDALTPAEQKNLISGALLLRNLIRIKIADDADILTASTALKSTITFLRKIQDIILEVGESIDVLAFLRDN